MSSWATLLTCTPDQQFMEHLKLCHMHHHCYGKSRNGRTNINMEGQRNNIGYEDETSESFGVSDCNVRSGDLDNEKT